MKNPVFNLKNKASPSPKYEEQSPFPLRILANDRKNKFDDKSLIGSLEPDVPFALSES